MNIFRTEPGLLPEDDTQIGQAMAHMATVGLIQERAIAARELLATPLQNALNSRVLLEQAREGAVRDTQNMIDLEPRSVVSAQCIRWCFSDGLQTAA